MYNLSLFFFGTVIKQTWKNNSNNYITINLKKISQIGEIAENLVKKKIIRKFISGQYLHDNQ